MWGCFYFRNKVGYKGRGEVVSVCSSEQLKAGSIDHLRLLALFRSFHNLADLSSCSGQISLWLADSGVLIAHR